jgi:transposase
VAVRWYLRFGLSYRDVEELLVERGVEVDHVTIYRWRRRGIWDRVLQALQADADARGELDWLLHYVDGSVVRAHQHAAGARHRPAKADLDTGGSGRS